MIKDHIKQFAELGSIVVDFTGGEPLMRKELPEIYREVKNYGMQTATTTNGWFVRKRIKEIASLLDHAQVSIDSPIPEEHDSIRGVKGAYDHAVDAVRAFNEYSIPVWVAAVLTKQTLSWDRIEKFSELGSELEVPINLNVVIYAPLEFIVDETEVRTKHLVDNQKAAELFRRARKLPYIRVSRLLIELLETGGNHTDRPLCRAATYATTVFPDGTMVMPCMHYPEFKVNINQVKVVDAWYSEKAEEVRRNCGRYPYCEGCLITCLLEGSQLAVPRDMRIFGLALWDSLDLLKRGIR
jgi:MoaA/NifB/PqqE/SkfB family radical SAM enzyme